MYRQSEKNLLNSNTSSTCPHNFGPLAAEICWRVWGSREIFNGFRVLAALLHGTLIVGVSQTLRRWTEGATYIRQVGHHVGHWPTFQFSFILFVTQLSREPLNEFAQIHSEDVFGPSLRRVWMPRSKVKVIRDKNRKTAAESSTLTMHCKAGWKFLPGWPVGPTQLLLMYSFRFRSTF